MMFGKPMIAALLLAVIAPMALAACSKGTSAHTDCNDPLNAAVCAAEATPPAGQAPVAPSGFVPGEVIAGLPLYPNAQRTNDVLVGTGGYPVQPIAGGICSGSPCPSLESAQAEYRVDATPQAVLWWYWTNLAELGYQRSGSGFATAPQGYQSSYGDFFNPQQPSVTVQVHAFYRSSDESNTLLDLVVVNQAAAPRPADSYVGADVTEVDISYSPGGPVDTRPATTTDDVTDLATVQELVRAANRMPTGTNRVVFCPALGLGSGPVVPPETIARFIGPSSEWAITMNDECPPSVRIDPPGQQLDDLHGLFRQALTAAMHPDQTPTPTPTTILPLPGNVPTAVPHPHAERPLASGNSAFTADRSRMHDYTLSV